MILRAWAVSLILTVAGVASPSALADGGPKGTIGIICQMSDGSSFNSLNLEHRIDYLRCLQSALLQEDPMILQGAPVEYLIRGAEDVSAIRYRLLQNIRYLPTTEELKGR